VATVTPLETILRRDRAVTLGALGVVVLASWAYVLAGAGMGMSAWKMSSLDLALGRVEPMPMGEVSAGAMSGGPMNAGEMSGGQMSCIIGDAMSAMATSARWNLEYAGIMVSMWWVMMIAMMVPSAAPLILLYAAVARRQREKGAEALLPTGIFASGYVAVWGFFSGIAAALQWGFEAAGILSPMMMNSTSLLFAAAILVAAGLYQLTPVKQACLRHCRGPIRFLMGRWCPGRWGAFRMGVEHGAYCLGCCWALMTLLFFGGVMNLYWIGGLAVMVLLEKTIPAGDTLGKVTGGLLMLWGGTFLYRAMA
jgi:predicted metal-binding membrane protein